MKKNENSLVETIQHKPVLISEVLSFLNIKPYGLYLDVTFGSGGHSRAILESEPTAKVIGLDWDQRSLDIVAPIFEKEFGERIKLIWGNFAHIYKIVKKHNLTKFDGILADFGTSQHQIFNHEGFSFRSDSFLDMRMSKGHSLMTASEALNVLPEKDLCKILFEYGEESFAKKIAKRVVEIRSLSKIVTSDQLAKLVVDVKGYSSKHKTHPATKTFQALRIFVNKELENIKSFLAAATSLLEPKGRFLCISFHSLEDRIVKEFCKEKESLGLLRSLTKKPVTATDLEMQDNLSSRSAKLRVAEKI